MQWMLRHLQVSDSFIFVYYVKYFFETAHLNWYKFCLVYIRYYEIHAWNCNTLLIRINAQTSATLLPFVGQRIIRPWIKQAKRERERSCPTEIDKESSTNNKPLNRICCEAQTRLTRRSLVNPRVPRAMSILPSRAIIQHINLWITLSVYFQFSRIHEMYQVPINLFSFSIFP